MVCLSVNPVVKFSFEILSLKSSKKGSKLYEGSGGSKKIQ